MRVKRAMICFLPTTRLVGKNVVWQSIRYVLSLQGSLTELNKKMFVHVTKKHQTRSLTLEISILSYRVAK